MSVFSPPPVDIDADNRKPVISLIDRLFSGVTVTVYPRVDRTGNRTHIGGTLDYHSPGISSAIFKELRTIYHGRDAREIVLHHLSLSAGMIYLPVFKLPHFVLEFFSQAVIMLRERKSAATFVARKV